VGAGGQNLQPSLFLYKVIRNNIPSIMDVY